MLKKQPLRALSPRHWARVRVPDSETWQKPTEWTGPLAGKQVDICVIPWYAPRYDSQNLFHWTYRVAYRAPGSAWPNYQGPNGSWITPWDFWLIDASSNSPNWDKATSDEHYNGRGKWLYEPASDEPALCPGGDWSRYECSICRQFVKPFSNDDSDLLCPLCEVPGLVILDDEQLDRLEQVREFARFMGLDRQLERQLHFLDGYSDNGEVRKRQCVLGYDFAPHSFSFCHYRLPALSRTGQREYILKGAMVYQGPDSPANGLGPSLCVSLAPGTGWFLHS
jgi:hypothetical protein